MCVSHRNVCDMLVLQATKAVTERLANIKCGLVPYAAMPHVGHGLASRASAHQRTMVALAKVSRASLLDRQVSKCLYSCNMQLLFCKMACTSRKISGSGLRKGCAYCIQRWCLQATANSSLACAVNWAPRLVCNVRQSVDRCWRHCGTGTLIDSIAITVIAICAQVHCI